MICYRVVRRKYADVTGEGARLYGGRHNPPGIPAVYAAASISLAILEVLVHLDKSEAPKDYVVMAIRFEIGAVTQRRKFQPGYGALDPKTFRKTLYRKPILRIPSVIVPRENNYILFPEVRGFSVSIDWIEPLDFDSRLFHFLEM